MTDKDTKRAIRLIEITGLRLRRCRLRAMPRCSARSMPASGRRWHDSGAGRGGADVPRVEA